MNSDSFLEINEQFMSSSPLNTHENHSSRPLVVVGNWKMYKNVGEALSFIETLTPLIKASQVKVLVAVPFTALFPAAQKVKELGSPLIIGAQNMNDASEGAFTGEIAGKMIKEAGGEFVILGHSERRHIFNESNGLIQRKLQRAFLDSLRPILCVGETEDERESGQMEAVLEKQLIESLGGLSGKEVSSLILAYEPVWAIGTGKVAHPKDAEEAHRFLRTIVRKKWGEEPARALPILYGGSVNPDNAKELIEKPEIDGLLVGGASLSIDTFNRIIQACDNS